MYQRVGKQAYKANLDNTIKLAGYLGNPEEHFKSIHVAGTNGKGSCSHMLASVLQEAGYKVGLYTSPHLKDFRERIRINGKPISKRSVSGFVSRHKAFFEANELSFFEMTVGLAFDHFKKEKVDIAVVEVGLGGRLDSTNIISPEVGVITNIGLDHTQFLGTTLTEIAIEKAGIIKPGIPVVIGETQAETRSIFEKIAKERGAPIYFAEAEIVAEYKTDLLGSYQQKNKRTVLAALQVLKKIGWKLPEAAIENGLQKVVANTGLLGRWQVLGEKPKIICDTAHNREGLTMVLEQLQNEPFEKLHVVLGMVNDKEVSNILSLFPKEATYYFCRPDVPRGLSEGILAEKAALSGLKGEVYKTVKLAYRAAVKNASKNDLIYVGGSTFVVAEVL